MKWMKNEIEFLEKNYYNMGQKYCSNYLLRSMASISKKAKKLNLTVDPHLKVVRIRERLTGGYRNDLYKLDATHIIHPISEKASYLLGFLWADGYINKKTRSIRFEIISEDFLKIKDIFENWTFYSKIRENKKEISGVCTSNRLLFDFLCENDYLIKSITSPLKILKIIPESLHNYFYRGLIDGDGCWYTNKKHSLRQFTLAGSYGQDWTAQEKTLQSLSVKYNIINRVHKKSKSSIIRITGKQNLEKLANFIYPSLLFDNLGLQRKYDKCYSMF